MTRSYPFLPFLITTLFFSCSSQEQDLLGTQAHSTPKDALKSHYSIHLQKHSAALSTQKDSPISWDSLPSYIKHQHPEISALHHLIHEARGKLHQAGLPKNPHLEVGFESDRSLNELMLTVGFSRQFPNAKKLISRQKASAFLVQAAHAEIQNAERLLLGQARSALIHIFSLQDRKRLLIDELKELKTLESTILQASKRGESSLLDVGLAQLESSQISQTIQHLDLTLQSRLTDLHTLLLLPSSQTLDLQGSLPPPLLPPFLIATSNRPDLKVAQLKSQSALQTIQLEQAQKNGDLEAGIYAGIGRSEDAPNGREGEAVVGLQFKIPLPYYNDNSGSVLAAQATQKRLSLQSKALAKSIALQTKSYFESMKRWKALTEKTQTSLLPLADQQVLQSTQAYQNGESSFQLLIQAKKQRLSLEQSYLESLKNFHLTRIQYLTETNQ